MQLRSLSIRTYLIFSYMALVLLFTLWGGAIGDYSTDVLLQRSMETTEAALKDVTAANNKVSEEILTRVGEYIVRDKAQDVARELAYLLPKKPPYDYAKLRRDPKIRAVAVQSIYTPQGSAGYTDVYDRHGYILFHPDPQVEGHNQLDWQAEYPEATELIKKSFTEDKVSGYFTFFDRQKRERRRFSVRVRIPGTPFIVAAIVNIDEFFLPMQKKIKKASQEVSGQRQGTTRRGRKGHRFPGHGSAA